MELTSDETHETITHLIRRSYRLAQALFDDLARPFGLSRAQCSLLMRIELAPGLSGVQLARLMSVTPQAVQGLLSELESRDLVERTPERGRALGACLTPTGEELLAACTPLIRNVQSLLLSDFTPREQVQFVEFLERLTRSADEALTGRLRGGAATSKPAAL